MAQIDHCVTAFGRRLLKQWVVRPLFNPDSIRDRQNAIEDIKVCEIIVLNNAISFLCTFLSINLGWYFVILHGHYLCAY